MKRKSQLNRKTRSITLQPRLEALEGRRLLTTFLVTHLDDAGDGSLRQAIIDANASEGADTIKFADDIRGTIELSNGQLEVTDAVTIEGPGADLFTISGGGLSRVFLVSATQAEIQDVTIAGGLATDLPGVPLPPGATAAYGGGVLNMGGQVSLHDVHVTGNQTGSAGVGAGAGVANAFGGTMTVTGSVFSDNSAVGITLSAGGAIMNDGASTLTVRGSTFSQNESTALLGQVPDAPSGVFGGAIGNAGGSTTRIFSSTFHDNRALAGHGENAVDDGQHGSNGGFANGAAIANTGVSVFAPPAVSTLYVTDSAFTNNHSVGGDGGNGGPRGNGGNGGGAFGAIHSFDGAVATIIRTALVGNQVIGGNGGNGGANGDGGNAGLAAGSAVVSLSSDLTMINSEIRDNVTMGGKGGNGGEGGNGGDGPPITPGAILVASNPPAPDIPSSARIIGSRIANNTVIGGDGGRAGIGGERSGIGGPARGGGINVDAGFFTIGERAPVSLMVTGSEIVGNVAQGGNGGPGADAGVATGGGISNFVLTTGERSFLKLRNTTISDNAAVGGLGSNSMGEGGGLHNTADLDVGPRDIDQVFANVADDCHDLFTEGLCIENEIRANVGAPGFGPLALLGDLDEDADVDADDTAVLARAIQTWSTDPAFDLNADEAISSADHAFLAETLIGAVAGDANLNGKVSFEDFLILATNFGSDDALWTDGDFDGDGKVAFSDFLALSVAFGTDLG